MVVTTDEANAKVRDLADRIMNEDIGNSLDILDKLASGELKLFLHDS